MGKASKVLGAQRGQAAQRAGKLQEEGAVLREMEMEQ